VLVGARFYPVLPLALARCLSPSSMLLSLPAPSCCPTWGAGKFSCASRRWARTTPFFVFYPATFNLTLVVGRLWVGCGLAPAHAGLPARWSRHFLLLRVACLTAAAFSPSCAMRHVDAGLFGLGLRLDSDQSFFHELSARLPSGIFDGHRSVLPSPDHLFVMSLTKLLLQAIFTILTPDLRPTLGVSLREALAHAGLPCTEVYNASNKTYVSILGISEWAAVCIIGPHACRRATRDALLTGPVTGTSPLGVTVDLLKGLYDLVRLAYLYLRAELDGEAACMDRDGAAVELRRRAALLLRSIRAACARPDCATLAAVVDVPNIHRMSEAVWHAVQLLG